MWEAIAKGDASDVAGDDEHWFMSEYGFDGRYLSGAPSLLAGAWLDVLKGGFIPADYKARKQKLATLWADPRFKLHLAEWEYHRNQTLSGQTSVS